MFFSVVVLVLTKALVAGKFTLITAIETSTKRTVRQESERSSTHSEAMHSECTVELWCGK